MRADAAANRQAILDAGWRLFAEKGEAVSMRAVAAEAHVGIGTLFRHFETRDDLLLGVFEVVGERIEGIVLACSAAWSANPLAAWRAFVHALADLEHGSLAYSMGPYVFRTDFFESAGEMRDRVAEELEGVLASARAAGLLREDIDLFRFFAGIASLAQPLPEHVQGILPDQRDWLVEVFLRGIAP